MTTTVYGSFYNVTGSLNPSSVVADYISGGDADWREQIEANGTLNAIIDDYTKAIDAALPDGIWLSGNEFIGPHHSDPDYDENISLDDFREIIEGVDLDEIVSRHDQAATEAATKAIASALATRTEAAQQLDNADEAVADAVRAALKLGVPAVAVADQLGVTRARVYQIRDGRR